MYISSAFTEIKKKFINFKLVTYVTEIMRRI